MQKYMSTALEKKEKKKRVLMDVTNTDAPSARRHGCGKLNRQIDNRLCQRSIKHQNQSISRFYFTPFTKVMPEAHNAAKSISDFSAPLLERLRSLSLVWVLSRVRLQCLLFSFHHP